MTIKETAGFAGLEIDDNDGVFAAIGDEGNVRRSVDADVIKLRFLRCDILAEGDSLHDLVCL